MTILYYLKPHIPFMIPTANAMKKRERKAYRKFTLEALRLKKRRKEEEDFLVAFWDEVLKKGNS